MTQIKIIPRCTNAATFELWDMCRKIKIAELEFNADGNSITITRRDSDTEDFQLVAPYFEMVHSKSLEGRDMTINTNKIELIFAVQNPTKKEIEK
jgi:hypothetical protein